jgi:hypothetical protein
MAICSVCQIKLGKLVKHSKCVIHRDCTIVNPCPLDFFQSQEFWDETETMDSPRKSNRKKKPVPDQAKKSGQDISLPVGRPKKASDKSDGKGKDSPAVTAVQTSKTPAACCSFCWSRVLTISRPKPGKVANKGKVTSGEIHNPIKSTRALDERSRASVTTRRGEGRYPPCK